MFVYEVFGFAVTLDGSKAEGEIGPSTGVGLCQCHVHRMTPKLPGRIHRDRRLVEYSRCLRSCFLGCVHASILTVTGWRECGGNGKRPLWRRTRKIRTKRLKWKWK